MGGILDMDYAISRYAQCATVSPGGIICCYLIFYSMRFLHGYAEHISAIMLLIIIFLNVTIFGKMAIENYAVRKKEVNIIR